MIDPKTKTIILFIIVGIALMLIAFFIITFSFFNKRDIAYRRKIKDESNTTRIYIIDVKKNSVTYFNRSDIRHKRTSDLAEFYNKFHPNDVDKVRSWILSICLDSKKAEQYLEADILVNRGRDSLFSLLKLLKFDPAVGLIHLESHLLRFITPTNSNGKKRKGLTMGVVKRSTMDQLISKNKSLRGFTFAIRFYYIRQKVLSNEKIERYMVMTLKNEIYPFANNLKFPRQIMDSGDNELLLFDLHIATREDALRLASSLSHSIKKSIAVNGFFESVNFSIGIIENSQYYQDFDMIVAKSQEACINAQQSNTDIYLYQKTAGQMLELNKYSEQIDNLLKEGNMRYLFRPIIDVSRKIVLGYFDYVKGYNTPFANFAEMSKYAAKVGKNRELFATVAKHIIPKFASEKQTPYCKLFFLVSMVDIDHMVEILPQISATKDINLVLAFDEQEVNENANQLELFIDAMNKLHEQGFEVALLLRDKNLLLDTSVYTSFDYFVAGAAMIGEIKKNSRIRLSIHSLIEQLLKYNKPIIATDLEGWQSIELIIKSGITKVSSEAISASNDMLLPVEQKKLEKLAAIDGNFH